MAKTLLVAHDLNPSTCLEALAPLVSDREVFLGFGGKSATQIARLTEDDVRAAQFVLVGMSSPAENATHELLALEWARANSVPFGIFSDTFGAYGRKWFEKFRDDCSLLFVTSPREVAVAQKLYANARVVVSGNPMWESYFAPPRVDLPAEIRAARHDGKQIVLAPGTKAQEVNRALWKAVIDASPKDVPTTLLAIPHPGSKVPVGEYDDLVEYGRALGITVILTPRGKSDDYVPFVDAIVGLNGGGSVPIHGICKRRLVIVYSGAPEITDWRTTNVGDARIVEESGAALMVRSLDELRGCLAGGIGATPVHPQLRVAQEQFMPSVPPGESVRIMRNAIIRTLYPYTYWLRRAA